MKKVYSTRVLARLTTNRQKDVSSEFISNLFTKSGKRKVDIREANDLYTNKTERVVEISADIECNSDDNYYNKFNSVLDKGLKQVGKRKLEVIEHDWTSMSNGSLGFIKRVRASMTAKRLNLN